MGGWGCVKTLGGAVLSWVRQGAGHGWKGWGKSWNPQNRPQWHLFPRCLPGEIAAGSLKWWTERVLQGPAWQKASYRSTSLITRAYYHVLLSQSGSLSQPLYRAGPQSSVLHLAWKIHFLWVFWWSSRSWEDCGCSFLGWSRTCPGIPWALGLQRCQSTSSSPFAEAMSTGLWDAEVQGAASQGWGVAACDSIQPFPLASQPYFPQQKSASFFPSMDLLALLLSHSVSSKHSESKSSLYP